MFKFTTTALIFALAACGSTKSGGGGTSGGTTGGSTGGTTGGGSTYVGTDVSGTVAIPAFNTGVTTDDLSHVTLTIVDALDRSGGVLGTAKLETTDPSCSLTACPFKFTAAKLNTLTSGVNIFAADDRATGNTWVKVNTAVVGQAAVDAAINGNTAITATMPYLVSNTGVAAFASALGISPATDFVTKGSGVGIVLNNAAGSYGAITGATATGPSTATVEYPTAAFDGKGTATSSTGLFCFVPAGTASVYDNFSITGASGDTHTWPTYKLGITPGEILVVTYVAN